MTDERKLWWFGLPEDQQRIRRRIAKLKSIISTFKWWMNTGYNPDLNVGDNEATAKKHIREAKRNISLLKCQLVCVPKETEFSLSVNASGYYFGRCNCGMGVDSLEYNFCSRCGAKLRWPIRERYAK